MTELSVMVTDNHWAAVADIETVCATTLQAAATALPKPVTGSVSILLTNNDEIADLNERMRGKSGPTNVLSFPAHASAQGWAGDIALAWGVVSTEAEAAGLALEAHLRHLLVHGFLHLHGYDHQNDDEAALMEDIERKALSALGVDDPYRDRDNTA